MATVASPLTPLESRMRREARRNRALLQARTSPPEQPTPATAPAPPPQIRSEEECSAELVAWLRTMTSFVLGPEGERYMAKGVLQSTVTSSAKVCDPMEVLDDYYYEYQGGKDADHEVHGTGVMEYEDGSYVAGCWEHGVRQGVFRIDTNKVESEVVFLEGKYREDKLEGRVQLQRRDGGWQEGWYKGGVPHGAVRFFDSDKQLTGVGMFRSGGIFGLDVALQEWQVIRDQLEDHTQWWLCGGEVRGN